MQTITETYSNEIENVTTHFILVIFYLKADRLARVYFGRKKNATRVFSCSSSPLNLFHCVWTVSNYLLNSIIEMRRQYPRDRTIFQCWIYNSTPNNVSSVKHRYLLGIDTSYFADGEMDRRANGTRKKEKWNEQIKYGTLTVMQYPSFNMKLNHWLSIVFGVVRIQSI